jgi:hypothetical protein
MRYSKTSMLFVGRLWVPSNGFSEMLGDLLAVAIGGEGVSRACQSVSKALSHFPLTELDHRRADARLAQASAP